MPILCRATSYPQKAIDKVKDNYDYILIDCPPNLYLVTQNALAASDYYIITTIPDHLSTIGINILIRKISELNNVLLQKYRIARVEAACVALKGILFTIVHKVGAKYCKHEQEDYAGYS
ncbi:MAG: AAA family ATPase [Planctomycetia bacterium]|nr:AAA family ATPase [Planctomycetia bacterium]